MNETQQSIACQCAECPGTACTCGCQQAAASTACRCSAPCACGSACACPQA